MFGDLLVKELTITRIRLKMGYAEQSITEGSFEVVMAINKDGAVENARKDLAQRLKIDAGDVKEGSVEDSDFPDMALGAPKTAK